MIKSLQSLRFFFALLIFLHHSALNLPALGAFPVSFFLLLSGFVLMKSYGDRIAQMSTWSFIKKRILRIYPTHILCLIIAVLSSLCVAIPVDWIKTVPSIFMMQAWIPNGTVYFAGNSVSWYVSICLLCYVLFPFLAKVIKKAPNILMIASVCTYLISCVIVPSYYQHALLYINPLFRLVDFIIGMWIFEMLKSNFGRNLIRKIVSMSGGKRFFCEIGSLLISILFISFSLKVDGPMNYAALWWIPSMVIIAVFSILDQNPGDISKILQNNYLVMLGSISYAFYLLHRSVLVVNNYLMEIHPINYVLDGIVVLAIVIVLAYIVTYYFEPLFTKKSWTFNEKK